LQEAPYDYFAKQKESFMQKRTLMQSLMGLLILMRPKQWVKNAFVLAPLIFSGEFVNANSVSHVLIATALYCLASSGTYIINDIHDVERDRKHPKKSKTRPIATGIVRVYSINITN
jgi:4-hydroxybenzoate polyprenyltransferase